ncbi:MAG: T9SS type A sorting domain-containing protein [Bacteroidales bacterium]|nr:T9SS type A sorting domain-containing protein [Bacteroidales bacterium]
MKYINKIQRTTMLLVLLIVGWATTYSVPLQAGDEASDVTVADGSASFLLSVKMPNKNGINYVYYSTDSNYGYLYGNDTIYVSEGENVYISYSLNSGYKRKSITVNGEVKNNSNNSFEFVMPSSNVEIVIDTEFDPSSPSDPQPADTTKYYNLALACNPSGAGSVSGKGKYAFGKSVNVSTSNNSGYVFKCWTKDGDTISTNRSFKYTMPASDVVLTAHYIYKPSSPTDPDQPKLRHPLNVIASPAGAGSFSYTGSEVTFDEEYYVYAYPNSGYKFKGWIVNGVAQEETSRELSGIMTEKGASVVGLFVFDPSSPSNPGANYYNETTGQAIIDDFTPGYLYDAIKSVVGSDNYENVSSLIVKGRLESGDYGYLSYLNKTATIDLSRTGGTTTVPGYAFQNLAAANILLSSEVANIGNYAFSGCTNLASLTIYAQVPPTCSSNTFKNFTNKDNCTVFVPSSAIELYTTADYWKDFTIFPISTDAHILQVNLPAEASDGRYKHNSLEIVNLNSGVRQKYVISDRLLYTFNGLRKDEQYNVYMYSQAGLEIGRIENVVIPDEDIEVTFDNLKTLHTVYAKVLTKEGDDVTSQVSIEWLKPLADGTTTYLRKATSISEIPDGQQLYCRVSLDDKLGTLYLNPEDVEFTVTDGQKTCTITLSPFRSIALKGVVVDGDGNRLSGASVSAVQSLNGKYLKTFTAKTDRNGEWTLAVLDAPETRIIYAASECINVNDTIGAFDASESTFDVGKVTMKSIVGARVTYGFTYHAAGVEEFETYYSDYQNVAIAVFNVTQNRAHNELSLQYPILAVLDENINAGDKLKLTATSKTGAFNPIEQTVEVGEDQRAEVTFDIVGKGGISASFEMTENPRVVAMLYSSKGELLKKMTYSEATAKFTELEDGNYTLVTMGQSDLMNSILRLSNFAEIGLTEGKDYVKNSVKVESGKLTEVKNSEIPAFDESLFYYTNSSTSFSTNKSSITTGNYLTLRSSIDFKGVYKDGISNVALIVDLPEACDFVEQSVIQGPNLLPYVLDGNRLTVQLGSDYKSQVRFCVVPTTGGAFNATASVVFDYNGKTITQPIGTAVSEIKDLEITVPTTINSEMFKVNGMAPGGSQIEVYEDDVLIGSVRALANGTWTAECIIPETYNFTTHTIYAIITTKNGLTLKSESVSFEFDRSCSSPKTVLMTFYNAWLKQNINVTFDFVNLTIDNPAYMFYTTTRLTFVADFTDNNPEHMSNVTLWTLSSNNTETAVTMSYDEVSGKWVGYHDFDYYSAPVNIALEYSYAGQSVFDRKQFSDFDEERESVLIDNLAERTEFIAAFKSKIHEDTLASRLSELFAQDEPDEEEIRRLLNLTGESGSTDVPIMSDEEFDDLSKRAETSWEDWASNGAVTMLQTALTDYYADPEYDLLSDYEITSELEDGIKTVSKKKLASVDPKDLEAKGYYAITLDDSSEIYILYGENLMEIIDCGQLIKYSIVIEPSTSLIMKSRANAPVLPGSYLYYATAAKNAIQSIYNLSNTDKRRWLVDVAQKIDEATQCISDFYESFMTDFNKNIETAYSGLTVLCDQKIEEQEALAEAAEERIKEYTNQIEANKQQRDVLRNNREFVNNSTTIPETQKQRLLAEYDEKIQKLTDENKHLNGKRAGSNTQLNNAKSRLASLKEQSSKFRKVHTQIRETLDKFPKRLAKGLRIPKFLRVCGKVAGELGIPLQCWSLFTDMMDMSDDIKDWIPLMDRIDSHFCYKKKEPNAVILRESIYDRANWHALHNVGILSSEIGAIGFSLAGGVPGSPTWWGEMGFSIVAEWWKFFNDRASLNDRAQFWVQVGSLKCDNPNDDNNNHPNNNHPNNNNHNYPFNPANPIHDPSGFVYEAVPVNRVEGVQATIYYKETKEDMYGDLYDEVVLWNAEEYAQKNPLFTDENGMYRWDVPQGLWQVKFEKDGYQTAYSEWLPVPPPQLEVNIGIVQNKQPEVKEARAYETGVEVQFDKFMDLSTLTTGNIYVTANGEKLKGEIRFIDSALADEYASEDDETALRYASRVRFVPEASLGVTTGEIRLTVSRNVLSYAGIPMAEIFSQVLDVEKEVQCISALDTKVLYGGEKEITVFVAPFDAAVGRTMHIINPSTLIASVDTTEVVLDEDGKAIVRVKGELPGSTQLKFAIDDVNVTGTCEIDVVTEIITAEAPKASRASGTAVYRGAKVELTTDSKDAVIYFTTDGSCPCDEEGTRRKYTVPIVINEDTKILAMTSIGTGDDDVSETVEFNYTLKRSDIDYKMEEGWTWISHNFESAISPSKLATDEGVHRILSQTQEVIRDPQLGMVGTLTELSASESYKVETTGATTLQRLSDFAWNPANSININSGWNWLGYPVAQTMSVDEAFAATDAETLDVIVGQNGFAQFDGEKWVGTLETMSPGMGYMYQSQSAKKIVYNTSIVSMAAAKHIPGISRNLPLVLDIHKYGQIMPVIATINTLDGSALENENYQVAAFCGSECRGIGRVVNGLVMMNVYGNINDNITFQVSDADGEKIFSNTASLSFTETVIGDIFNPYAITIDNTTGITDAKYSGKIKVSVKGDVLRIKGIKADDIEFVEVYDLNGQRVLRETNVSESGIKISTLMGGVYVVIVNGKGEYTYHKIAIR